MTHIIECPVEVIKAAKKVALWFDMNNIKQWKLAGVASREFMEEKESELADLREKCAELEKDLQVIKGQYHGACDIIKELEGNEITIAELQRQLDEAAKQEPVARLLNWNGPSSFCPFDGVAARTFKEFHNDGPQKYWSEGDPLYRLPPNLPAIIEQAKAEEREEMLKDMRKAVVALAHAAESNPAYQDVYKELDTAIRARSEK